MKYIVLLLLCFCIRAAACDICGGFMGITPYDNFSSLSFQHRYRVFNGYRIYGQPANLFVNGAYKEMHGGNNTTVNTKPQYSSKDFESYKTYELRGKYFIHRRVELNVFVPINSNKSKADSTLVEHTGLGDPSLFAGFHLIRKLEPERVNHKLIVGAGCKMPSGNFYATDKEGMRIDPLLQPGTGSFDLFVYANYIFGYKKFGFSFNSLYKRNGINYFHELIGNSSNNFLNIFVKLRKNKVTLIPSAQIYFEHCEGLYIQGNLQKGSSMINMLAGPGFEIFYKKISFNISGQKCVYEKIDENQLRNAGRLVVGFTYNFAKNSYLFKSKSDSNN